VAVALVAVEQDGNKVIHMEEMVHTSLNSLRMAHQEVTSPQVAVAVDGQDTFMVLVLAALVAVALVDIMVLGAMVRGMVLVEELVDIPHHLGLMDLLEQYLLDTKKKPPLGEVF
jgi:hypothetical protein